MPRPEELAQWEIATNLVVKYGDEVGAFVLSKLQACRRSGNEQETQYWTRIVNKVEALTWGATDNSPRQ